MIVRPSRRGDRYPILAGAAHWLKTCLKTYVFPSPHRGRGAKVRGFEKTLEVLRYALRTCLEGYLLPSLHHRRRLGHKRFENLTNVPRRVLTRCAAACALVLLFAQGASAHKLVVFAYVDGDTVRGEAYFHGGSPAQKAEVRVLDPQGTELTKTTTDSQGEFAFKPPVRCDLKLLITTSEGHTAQFTVPAGELPETLPGSSTPVQQPARKPAEISSPGPPLEAADRPAAVPSPAPRAEGPQVAPAESLANEIAELRKQVQALRQQLFHYEQKVRWHDVLGGIGYILGLSGAAFYFLAGKRTGRKTDGSPP